jgi:hypothetical protein
VAPTCPGTLSAGRIPLVTMRNYSETLTRSRTVTNRRAMAAPDPPIGAPRARAAELAAGLHKEHSVRWQAVPFSG